jgi:hypothetical protein
LARIVALAPDLFFAAKIEETLGSAGHEVTVVARPDALPADADVVIVDLDRADIALEPAPAGPVIGFYSHVDVEARRRGEDAGFALVVPRSRMAREMPQLVERLLGS